MAMGADRENPFPGLRPFEMLETHLFFGREEQVDVLAGRLTRSRFVAVVGSSGSGKSSLVRAGLLPALYGGSLSEAGSLWKVALFRPGDDPIGNLAATLAGPKGFHGNGGDPLMVQTTLRRSGRGLAQAWREAARAQGENLLIVVDQFEELFRVSRSQPREQAGEEAAGFVRLLLESVREPDVPLYVLLTMRSDFLGHCARFRDLPETLSENQYLIPRLTRDQLRSAIAGPVAVGGAEITPRLVQRVLNDIGDNQDQLPVLQHALMRTWRRWAQAGQDRPLDLEDYDAVGGLERALSIDAEEAFGELPPGRSREVARRLFQAITERAAAQSETRRPTRLDDIAAISDATPTEVIAVVEAFRGGGRAFLMPPHPEPLVPTAIVDISHESLIRQWGRLRRWVAEEAESRAMYLRLADAARLRGEAKAGLWRDPQLELALRWWRESGANRAWASRYTPESDGDLPSPFDAARAFLGESEQARRREQQARSRWFYLTVGGLGALAVTFLVLFLLMARALNAEREQADLALARQLAAQSQQIRNEEPADLDLSVLLAVESLLRAPGEGRWREGGQALQSGLSLLWGQAWQFPSGDARAPASFVDLAASPDRRHVAVAIATDSGSPMPGWILEMASGRPIARFEQTAEDAQRLSARRERRLAFSADGRYLTTGSRVYETLTGNPVAALSQPGRVLAADFGGAALVATGGEDKTARVFEATTGREVLPSLAHGGPVEAVAFSPRGRRLATGSWDGKLRVFETATGNLVLQRDHQEAVEAVAWSANDRYVATGSRDRQARVFDAASGAEVARLGHRGEVRAVAVGPDARYVATASRDRTARVLEVATSTEMARLEHQGEVGAVAWSPDGRSVVTGSRDGTARVFEPMSGTEVARLGHEGRVLAVAFGPEGRRVATASLNEDSGSWAVRAFEASVHGRVARVAYEQPVIALALSGDGRYVATVSRDGLTRVLETDGGKEVARLTPAGRAIETVALSADGRRLATGRRDGGAAIWDVSGGRELVRLAEPPATAVLAFSPDGRYLSTGKALFEAESGQLAGSLGPKDRVRSVAFSSDARRLAAGDQGGLARVLDVPSGKEVARLAHRDPVFAVALSKNGRRLATRSADGKVRVFDVGSPKPTSEYDHPGNVPGIALDGDGRLVATLGEDGKVRVYDARSGQPVADFPHQARGLDLTPGVVSALAFTREGQQLLVVWQNAQNEVIVERHELEPKRLIAQACARVGRNLSAGEWNQYLPGQPFRKTCPDLP